MITVYDTLKEFVDNLDLKIYVSITSDNVVTSSNTLYVREGDTVSDYLGNEYVISSMVVNGSITLAPVVVTDVFSGEYLEFVDVNAPTFILGKPTTVNSEYLQIDARSRDKLPLVWLLTDYEEQIGDEYAPFMIVNSVRLFLLEETNEREWLTSEHYTIVISRMNNLSARILSAIKESVTTNYTDSYRKPLERFGKYVSNKGNKARIIDEMLSGVELRLNLEIVNCC